MWPVAKYGSLVKRGLVVEQDGVFFSAAALDTAQSVLAEMLAAQPAGVTVAEVRERLRTTRQVTPSRYWPGWTAMASPRRRGDVRIAGPRLPEV